MIRCILVHSAIYEQTHQLRDADFQGVGGSDVLSQGSTSIPFLITIPTITHELRVCRRGGSIPAVDVRMFSELLFALIGNRNTRMRRGIQIMYVPIRNNKVIVFRLLLSPHHGIHDDHYYE